MGEGLHCDGLPNNIPKSKKPETVIFNNPVNQIV
jgi:hypothetical protein